MLYRHGPGMNRVTGINIDAVTRWIYQGMPVDGLQRICSTSPIIWLATCCR